MKTKVILYLIPLFLSVFCRAQEGRLLTVDRELSSSMINDIYQDKEDIIWIATEDGLNSYDGTKFVTYRHQPDDSCSLNNNYVRKLFEDSKGRFFVCTLTGLQLYDRATGQFRNVPIFLSGGISASANVSSILERHDGTLVAVTSGHGLFYIAEKDGELCMMQYERQLPSYLLDNIYEDKNHVLWVVAGGEGIYSIAPDKKVTLHGSAEGIGWPSSVCEDKRGNLYAGCLKNGLFRYDPQQQRFVHIDYPQNPQLPVKTLCAATETELYIGTDGNGMKVYNLISQRVEDRENASTNFDFTKTKVHDILIDKQGNTWLGLFQRGVLIQPTMTNAFYYMGYKSPVYDLIGSNCVMSICKADDGILWIGTDNDGLYGISPVGTLYRHYTQEAGMPQSVSSTIMSICETSDHRLYIGSFRNGLARLDPATGQCVYIPLRTPDGYEVQSVYSIVEDSNDQLWIGTLGTGLFCMDLRTDQVRSLPMVRSGLEYNPYDNILSNRWINCLLPTHTGKLYIGTYDGLACLDLVTEDFVSTYKVNRLLPGEVVLSLCEDQEGFVWVGTSYGLHCLNPANGEIQTFTTDDGLPNNSISAIQGDMADNLWISTNAGLSRYDKYAKTFVNFHAADGLQGNEFSRGASFRGKDGLLWFGGTSGVTFFYPASISERHSVPQIRLTDFYLHDRPVRMGMKSGSYDIVDEPVSHASKFRLAHDDNSFSIDFSAMEFYNPERITYQYAFNSVQWVTLSPGINRVSFSGLAPGTYHFRVRAKDYSVYSETKEITIQIFPPWYALWWAKLCYFILICSVGVVVIREIRQRYRARQQMLEHIHAEQLNEAKLQFFINVSHEIRTPMSLIISPLHKLMTEDHNPDRQRTYQIIYRNAERILRLINQLMDIRKIDKGQMRLKFQQTEMTGFLKELYATFEYQAKMKHIVFEFQPDMEELYLWIDPKNFDKVVLNILSNAFKYTPEYGSIRIGLHTGTDEDAANPALREYAEITVEDSGIGINPADIERIFDRFYQSSNSQNKGTGTGVGLHLTKSLVALHHGSIWAKNNEGCPGSCFTIRIPLGHDHLKPEEIEAPAVENVTVETQAEPLMPSAETDKEEADVPQRSKTNYTVLVVEDDEEIRRYVCSELGRNFHTEECGNGKEALSYVLKRTPDLVISDVMMPEMDGMTLCKKIKQNIHVNHVPVILLTALSDEQNNIEGLHVGADAYIAKPFNIEILRNTVFNLIRMRELLKNNYTGKQNQEQRLSKLSMESVNPDEQLMDRVMCCINENLDNPHLNVEMIATAVSLSRTHLNRKLKELTNQAPRDFIRNIRLKQAASLLADSRLTVADVALMTGFSNTGYFPTAFKDLYGITPTAFKEQGMEKTDEGNQKEET